jgi:hypothetical protein
MRTTALKLLLGVLLFAVISLSGCASLNPLDLFSSSPETQEEQSSAQSRAEGKRKGPDSKGAAVQDGVEVVWLVPTEPVDAFIIRYGYRPAELTQETKITAPQLQKTQDPHYGTVYRYVIQPVESGKNVYVAIASVKGDQISEFSSPMEEQAK